MTTPSQNFTIVAARNSESASTPLAATFEAFRLEGLGFREFRVDPKGPKDLIIGYLGLG